MGGRVFLCRRNSEAARIKSRKEPRPPRFMVNLTLLILTMSSTENPTT